MAFLDEVNDLHEGQRLELKEAAFEVPDEIWKSYSAFANTEGGEIVLGVRENPDRTFTVTGVVDAGAVIDHFWTSLRNPEKVERDILFRDSVRLVRVDDADVVVISVPRAERGDKPVRVKVKRDKQFCAWIRRGTADIRATSDDLKQMDYDNAERADRRALEDFSVDCLNDGTIARYRAMFASIKPTSPWNSDSKEDFLYHIGALARGRDGNLCPTQAGLLAFGNEYEITNLLPHYLLDYRQQTSVDVRWEDRIVSQSGEWSGNLIDFYFDVTGKLLHSFKAPFITDETGTRHGVRNPITEALNEAIANALVHAYYGGKSSIVILHDREGVRVSNPGNLLIDRDVAIGGGVSEQRNPTLMRIFSFMGVSDRAGSGVQTIFDTWRKQFSAVPKLIEEYSPSAVSLFLPLPDTSTSNGDQNADSRMEALDDARLHAFIAESGSGVTSREVVKAFGVSLRVAQKHLARLFNESNGSITRSKVDNKYVYSIRDDA